MTARRRNHADERRLHVRAGITVAIALVAIAYVSFTALSGLPGQSTYDISVELPNASRLVKDDTVRIHGVRVGRIVSVSARPATATRPPYAVAKLALQTDVGPLPVDTGVRTRAASLLGASYIALEPGRSARVVHDGGALALADATSSVDVTDLFDVFDRRTSQHIQHLFGELGDGMAGRGPALGDTLTGLSTLLGPTTRVMQTLSASQTRLTPFIRSYTTFAYALAPVAPQMAGLVRGGATTFGALGDERRAVAGTIARLPRAERALTGALLRLAPALDGFADISVSLRPAARELSPALRATNRALDGGAPALRGMPAFSARLRTTFDVLAQQARRPSTGGLVRKLQEVARALAPTAKTLKDMQVNCNSMGNMLEGFSSITTDNSVVGSSVTGQSPLAFAFLRATHLGARGELLQQPRPASNVAINYLPHENDAECEAGNEPHDAVSQILANPPGNQAKGDVPETAPPASARKHAQTAGLLDTPRGWHP